MTDSPIVLVWTMGKVATTSITLALKRCNQQFNFCHNLNPAIIDDELRLANGRPELFNQNLVESIMLTRYIPAQLSAGRRLKIITSVRDPVARNISAFFETLEFYDTAESSLIELSSIFFEDYPHSIPLEWFDIELKEVFGIDVFKYPFNKVQGWSIYEFGLVDLLIFRSDLSLVEQGEAMRDFLGAQNIAVVPENLMSDETGSGKAPLYASFLKEMKVPAEYLNKMYNSRYAKHFWNEEQIKLMASRWISVDEKWESYSQRLQAIVDRTNVYDNCYVKLIRAAVHI